MLLRVISEKPKSFPKLDPKLIVCSTFSVSLTDSSLGNGRISLSKQYCPLITGVSLSMIGLVISRHSSYSPKSERTPSANPDGGKRPIESMTNN